MSTDRIKGKIAFLCDGADCSEGLETDHAEFAEALEQAKEEGWLVRKRGETWMHFCSSGCEGADYRERG